MFLWKKLLITFAAMLSFASMAPAAERLLLDENNTVVLRGEVTEESVAKASEELLTNPNKDVYLFISSPGGSILAGMQLANLVKNSGKNVKCVASFAASMAFYLLQACPVRYVLDYSIIMQHVAAYGVQGQEPNNWSMAKFIHRLNRRMDEEQAKRLGMPYAKFRELVRDDWWLYGDEAVHAHAADALVTAQCSAGLIKKHTNVKIQQMFWTFDVEFSACPLIEGPTKVKADQSAFGNQTAANREYRQTLAKLNVRDYMMKMYSRKKDSSEENSDD